MKTPKSSRGELLRLIEQGAIPAAHIDAALEVAEVQPSPRQWRSFIDHGLLWLGALALAFSLLFFIAYNWAEFGRIGKFVLVQCCMVAAVVVYWRLDSNSAGAKAMLMVTTLLLGVLMALYGQTYQTGADPWQLFFTWALLMLPWALVARFAAIWVFWLLLLNVAALLYQDTFGRFLWFLLDEELSILWFIALLNSGAWVVWEALRRRMAWLDARWAIRLLGITSGGAITWMLLYSIFDFDEAGFMPVIAWLLFMCALYVYYRFKKPDLFMLAGGCLSLGVAVVCFTVQVLDGTDISFMLFVLAVLVISLGAMFAMWLKHVNQALHS